MSSLLAHCVADFSSARGLIWVFFLGGLTGSITHCLAMCGPVVACHSACGNCSKTTAFTQWDYHLGRLLTYGTLGFFAALLSKQVAAYAFWPYLSAAMLVLAGCMFIASSLPSCKHPLFKLTSGNRFLRGLFMGFLPCGLVYAALMMAATLANPIFGMVAMWVFGLGTLPALLLAGFGPAFLTLKWQRTMDRIGRAVMAFNGFSLIVIAGRMMR